MAKICICEAARFNAFDFQIEKDIIDTKHVPPSEVKVTKLERKSVKSIQKYSPHWLVLK